MRPAAALVIALALALPGVAAQEADAPFIGVEVPLPRDADAARYAVSSEGEALDDLLFAWRPARFPDAWGRMVDGYEAAHDRVGASCQLEVPDAGVSQTNAPEGALISVVRFQGDVVPVSEGDDVSCMAGAMVDADSGAVGAIARSRFDYAARPYYACAMRHALQGQRVNATTDLARVCADDDPAPWRYVGNETLRGFAVVNITRANEGDDIQTMWLAHGLAYPLAFERVIDGTVYRYDLDALKLDGAPLAAASEPAPAQALRALDPLLGPDDADAQLPVRLSDAARAAVGDLTLTALQAVLADDGAALAGARMVARAPPGAPPASATWVLRFAAPGGGTALVTCTGPAGAPGAAVRCVAGSDAASTPPPDAPPAGFGAASLPPLSATFADAVARWRIVEPDAQGEPLLTAEYQAWDGDAPAGMRVGTTDGGVGGSPGSRAQSSAFIGFDGRTLQHVATRVSPLYVDSMPDALPGGGALPVQPAPSEDASGPVGLAPVGSGSRLTAVVVAAAALSLVALLALLLKGTLAAFFTRLVRPKVLDQEVRAAVHEHVSAQPGSHAAAIAEALGRAQNVVDHHLDVLVREAFLTRLDTPGFRRYFVAGRFSHAEMRAMAALAEGQAEKLYRIIEANPGIHLAELAQRAGLSEAYASRSVKKLAQAGLVDSTKVGRAVRLHALER